MESLRGSRSDGEESKESTLDSDQNSDEELSTSTTDSKEEKGADHLPDTSTNTYTMLLLGIGLFFLE